MLGEIFFGGSVFTTLLLYIICLTHFHHIQKASPQLYGRLPMRLLKSTTEFIQPPRPLGSYYESKGSHEILWYQNSESRAMVNWTIPSALLYRPSQKIVLHYLFLFSCTPPSWNRFMYLLDLFVSHQSVSAIWEPSFKLSEGFSGGVHTRSVCCFNLQGGSDVTYTNNYSHAIPTILILAIPPIGWYSTSIATCKRHIGYIRLQQMIYVGHLSRTYTFILHTDDLVYLWRIRTWNYYHIDKECKMGFLHQQRIGDNDIR